MHFIHHSKFKHMQHTCNYLKLKLTKDPNHFLALAKEVWDIPYLVSDTDHYINTQFLHD